MTDYAEVTNYIEIAKSSRDHWFKDRALIKAAEEIESLKKQLDQAARAQGDAEPVGDEVKAMMMHLAESVFRSATGRMAMPSDQVSALVADAMEGYTHPPAAKVPDYWLIHQNSGLITVTHDKDEAEHSKSLGQFVDPVAVIINCESEGGEAVFVTGEPLYIRLTKDLTEGSDETVADIEDGNGFSVKISRIEDGNDWLIGPIYEAPKSNRPQPDKWIPCSERLPTEADADCYGTVVGWDSVHDQAVTMYPMGLKYRKVITHWMPTGLTRPAPPEQESE